MTTIEPFADPSVDSPTAPGGPYDGTNDPEPPQSVLDAYVNTPSPTDLWNALRTRLGVVTEQPDVPGGGSPALPGEHQETEAVEDVGPAQPKAPPHVVVHHIMEAREVGANLIRPRTIRVAAQNEPVQLLQRNPNRRRALIRCGGSSQAIGVFVGGSGLSSTAAAAANASGGAFYLVATGDPPLEVKATTTVWAALQTSGPCDVSIWEELNAPATGAVSEGGTIDLEGLI